jgi:tRNA(Ile)-lysidine synthase
MKLDISLFKKKWSFIQDSKVFVGLSGGVDSVVLFRLLLKCGFDVEALHVNYQLRDKESDEDEAFVRNLCAELKIPLHVKKVDFNEKIELQNGNLQEVARNIRYDFFQSFKDTTDKSFLAIAHHEDDQIETFFLNLSRKSGLRGMSCMLDYDNEKIRPLLHYSKEEIVQFALENNWIWREDKSNQSLKYKRNVLRNKYIPEMIQLVPDLKESVLTLISKFQFELKEIQYSLDFLYNEVLRTGLLSLEDFKGLTEYQQVELLFLFGFKYSEIQSFSRLLDAQKGKFIETHQACRVFREKEGFSFEKYFPKVSFKYTISKVNELPLNFSKEVLFFDADLVEGEICMRPWKQSDRLSPIGMKGSKLISDVLNDAKLKAIERLQWPVLVDVDGILSCPLISVSKQKIAKQNSTNIICVQVEKVIC